MIEIDDRYERVTEVGMKCCNSPDVYIGQAKQSFKGSEIGIYVLICKNCGESMDANLAISTVVPRKSK